MLNLDFKDVLAALVPAGGAFWLILTNIKAGVEKHKITQKEETLRHQETIQAEAERERKKIEADVEKEKVKAEVEINKAKEQSVGGEAVVKIWKSVDALNQDIRTIKDVSQTDHANDEIMKNAVTHLQTTVEGFVKLIFDKILK